MIVTLLLTIFILSSYILSLYITIMYWFYTHQFVQLMYDFPFFGYITNRRAAIFTIGFPITALLLGCFMLISYMKTFVCEVTKGVVYLWKLALFGEEKNSRNEKEKSKV